MSMTIAQLPATVNFKFVRGDDFSRIVHFANLAGPVDVTGWVFSAQLRRAPGSAEVIAAFVIDTSDALNGNVTLTLLAAVTATFTGKYRWDLQRVAEGETRTIMAGTVTVTEDVTHG